MTFWVALVVIVLDQLTKYYVRATMELGESIPVIPNMWHWTYIENHGAAFGILAHQQWFFLLVVPIFNVADIAICVAVACFCLFFWRRGNA